MKITCELAEYKRALYQDQDAGVIATIKFPYLSHHIVDDEINKFDFDTVITTLQKWSLRLDVWGNVYHCVRFHWFEYNQPLRMSFPDIGPPIVLLVLQVYMPPIKMNDMHTKLLTLIV